MMSKENYVDKIMQILFIRSSHDEYDDGDDAAKTIRIQEDSGRRTDDLLILLSTS